MPTASLVMPEPMIPLPTDHGFVLQLQESQGRPAGTNPINFAHDLRGGFLRRASTTISYLTARKRERERRTLEQLSVFPLLKDLPPEHVNTLLSMIRPGTYEKGAIVFHEGQAGTELLFGLATLAGFLAAISFKLLG